MMVFQTPAQSDQSATSFFQDFVQGSSAPIALGDLLLSLGIGVVLAILLQWHFRRYGSTLSNREQFGRVFPFVLLTTLLIITIVKSSLALSLGLVGALSIVRFRTPIKEPEELSYLFIAIAIGLGLGAHQFVTTIVGSTIILLVIAIMRRRAKSPEAKNLFLSIEWSDGQVAADKRLEIVNEAIRQRTVRSDLRRFDIHDTTIEITYFVDLPDPTQLSGLVKDLHGKHPEIGITFIDQNQLPSL